MFKTIKVDVHVDEAVISKNEPWTVIEPVWWSIETHNGPVAYEETGRRFTTSQRQVAAMGWYSAEVDNGGHDQFYGNSTGIVWREALEGFCAAAMADIAAILRESVRRLGGDPPLDTKQRRRLLDASAPNFGDLDEQFYAIGREHNFEARIMRFIRERPDQFFYHGPIEKTVRVPH